MSAATSQFHDFIAPAATASLAKRPSIFARIADAIQTARQRQVERDIGHLIEMRGGRLTDDLERQIGDRLF